MSFTWNLVDWLELSFNSTNLDSDNQSKIKVARGKKLPGIYHQTYGGNFKFSFRDLDINLSYQHQSELYYDTANAVEADSNEDINLSITYYLENISFDITGRNLLDENINDFNRMPTAGRSYITTITFDF